MKVKAYKYRLQADFRVKIPVIGEPFEVAGGPGEKPWATLAPDGWLTIRQGYSWDGASGPTIDRPRDAVLESSAVHDVLYQAMRQRHLPQSFRQRADAILRDMLIERGVWRWRAWAWYWAVRAFAASSAAP